MRNTRLVAVIGSYGKTTTVRAIVAALGIPSEPKPGNSGAYVAHALLRIPVSSRHGVLEVGINGRGQMELHSRMLRPDLVVITSIGWEHHRTFGSLEETRSEKVRMLTDLPASATVVLNREDPNVLWMRDQTLAQVVTYGQHPLCDLRATDLTLEWPRGMTFKLHYHGRVREVRSQLMGAHFVPALQAAAAVALLEGFDLDEIIPRLEGLAPTPGRLQPVRLCNGAMVLRDDYKSSLETIDAALDLLAEIEANRKFVVLGEVSEPPGSQGSIYRQLGRRIAEIADFAVFLGGNFQRYAAGARRAGFSNDQLMDGKRDVLAVVGYLQKELKQGDVVLVKGRDTQRLDRIGLALSGVKVSCTRTNCGAVSRCHQCPELD